MINAFDYFPSARSIDSHLMSVQLLMNGLGKWLVNVLTITRLLIHQAVLALSLITILGKGVGKNLEPLLLHP